MKVNSEEIKNLSLYHHTACPYCIVTRQSMERLDLDVELRDIRLNPAHNQELVTHGGKQQVPCLKIETETHGVQWMYESSDIIAFLNNYSSQSIA